MIEKKPLYLHPARLRAVIHVLQMIFEQGRYADKAIGYELKNNPKAGSNDRAFIAEHAYEIVRYFRYYTTWFGRIPDSEDDWWKLLGIYFLSKGYDLPSFTEFEGVKAIYTKGQKSKLLKTRPILESIPDWLEEIGLQEIPDQWAETVIALNKPAEVILRANTLQNTRDALMSTLQAEQVETIAIGQEDALQLKVRSNIFQTKAFKDGKFEVQDFSSQQVALYLDAKPGMRVIDACAGGGGKTLHIAAMMQNKGTITAMDTFAWKLQELKLRARRAGVHNIRGHVIEGAKSIKRHLNSADRLLLDVPCSGLGVLRRNPDAKWKLSEEFLDRVRTSQQEILHDYSGMCKPGGYLVYATCSILPSENRNQVDQFLQTEAGAQFTLKKDQTLWPQAGYDGFYMAQLERKHKP
jgi:16S rRNA (cytosine967-C5)-methyltransferase